MATGNVVITSADIGPGNSIAALNVNDIRELRYDFPGDRLQIIKKDGELIDLDYDTLATITHVIAASVATITLSK